MKAESGSPSRKHVQDQLNVLRELRELLQLLPEHVDGAFYGQNRVAFAALDKTKSELTDEEVEALEQAMYDLAVITSSSRLRIKYLADIGCSEREILNDIRSFDEGAPE